VSRPSTNFPSDTLCGLVRKLDAIVRYHNEGIGYAREQERLLRVTIMEMRITLNDLDRVAKEWGVECQVSQELREPDQVPQPASARHPEDQAVA
jgi:hypothetical protein